MLIPVIVVCRLRLVVHLKLGIGQGDKEVRIERVRGGWFWAKGSSSQALSGEEQHLLFSSAHGRQQDFLVEMVPMYLSIC